MSNFVEYFKTKWRRPKHKGVSGNYSTVVIITSVIIGSFYMSGGSSPQLYLNTSEKEYGEVLQTQPKHGKEGGITFRELRMKVFPTGRPTPIPTFGPPATPTVTPTAPPASSQ